MKSSSPTNNILLEVAPQAGSLFEILGDFGAGSHLQFYRTEGDASNNSRIWINSAQRIGAVAEGDITFVNCSFATCFPNPSTWHRGELRVFAASNSTGGHYAGTLLIEGASGMSAGTAKIIIDGDLEAVAKP